MVTNDGYQMESHYVETADGYKLKMHRIHGSNTSKSENKKHPVFVKHGLGECSTLFILSGPKRALGKTFNVIKCKY